MRAYMLPLLISATAQDAGKRLDQFLAAHLPQTSRARVQQLIAQQLVLVNDAMARASLRLRGGERVSVLGLSRPLRAMAEDIPLEIVFEDADLAVVNKPAGMTVHAGAGATDDQRNRGTLVNALLHHFGPLSLWAASCAPESCIASTRPPADCWWWPRATKRTAGWPASLWGAKSRKSTARWRTAG